MSTRTSLRLFTRAPCTRIRSWLSAVWGIPSSPWYARRSVLGQRGERLLGFLVPAHPLHRVLPAALHVLEGRFVGRVALGDRIPEVLVLQLDHLVGGLSTKREVAGTAQLLAGHRLHLSRPG